MDEGNFSSFVSSIMEEMLDDRGECGKEAAQSHETVQVLSVTQNGLRPKEKQTQLRDIPGTSSEKS
eukprot:3141083-Amphidinium_carterae.2